VNVQDIDLNLLRVFDAVLQARGVTPAAARLGLTQPAVSNALARLRALFGDPLFLRTPGGMDATPFARELAEPVRQALALLESALAHGPGFDPATSSRAFRFGWRRPDSMSRTSARRSPRAPSTWRSASCRAWPRRFGVPRSSAIPIFA
jgi:DNA-binding transcriptional LysR family regulator